MGMTKPVDPTQARLLAAARDGDEREFSQLVEPYQRELHQHCYRMLGSVHDADKPAAKRRWEYFALPILYGDRLVGKLDATADREAGVLRVHAVHQDVSFTKTVTAAIGQEIKDLAHRLELDLTPPG